jgi:hypothetical protein
MMTEAKAMRYNKWQIQTSGPTVFGEILVRVRHECSSYLVAAFKTRKEAADFLRALRRCTN